MLGQKSDTSKKNASSTKNSDAELNKSKYWAFSVTFTNVLRFIIYHL